MVIPPRSLAAGVPAKVLRELSEQEMSWKIEGTRIYQQLTRRSLATLVEVDPLTACEPDRRRFEFPGIVPLIDIKKRSPTSE